MPNPWQFSLAFLFSELLYVGLTLGCFRGYWLLTRLPPELDFQASGTLGAVLFVAAFAAAGAAIGGCFGKPGHGSLSAVTALLLIGGSLILIVMLFGPRVY